MKLKPTALILSFAVLTSSCGAPENWTREQQESITTRSFPGQSTAQIVEAAETVLRLAGGENIRFDYRSSGFVARRSAAAFFIIGGQLGDYVFDFSAQTGRAELRIIYNTSAVTTLGVLPANTEVSQVEGSYALFFSRLAYLLGRNDTWVPCDNARRDLNLRTSFEALCLNAPDLRP